jgi:hypothetical protein
LHVSAEAASARRIADPFEWSKKAHTDGKRSTDISINDMAVSGLRNLVILAAAVLVGGFCSAAFAQSGEQKPPDQQKAGESKKSDSARQADQIAEAARTLTGPAANPECVWLGERVVNLLSRDDLDTAFRHLDLYDRFGCPGAHVQASFRCMVRQPPLDPKAADTLDARVHTCWINPNTVPAPPAATAAPPPAATAGTGAH